MNLLWQSSLWQQFGAAIDTLDNALAECPDSLWLARLWNEKSDPPPSWFPSEFPQFWYLAYHTLVWLDLYLLGVPEDKFAPPVPFTQGVIDSKEAMPETPYSKEELRSYLATLRQKCSSIILALTDERASTLIDYGWNEGQPVSYLELLLYNLRHVQEHAAYFNLFLGQHGVPDEKLISITRANG